MKKLNPKMCEFHGITRMDKKGQVVIPSRIRKILNLSAGDKLLVVTKFNKAVGFIKADKLEELINMIEKEAI